MQIEALPAYAEWASGLRDERARARIAARLLRLVAGNPGDHRNLTGGISELRIDYGPGYRVYYAKRGDTLILLLGGGDKSRQDTDIKHATRTLKGWEDGNQS
jgi:putative addiction module killer protein